MIAYVGMIYNNNYYSTVHVLHMCYSVYLELKKQKCTNHFLVVVFIHRNSVQTATHPFSMYILFLETKNILQYRLLQERRKYIK